MQNIFRWTANGGLAVLHDNRALERTGMLTDGLDQGGTVQIIGDPLLSGLFPANDIAGLQHKLSQNVLQRRHAGRIYKVLDDIRLNSLLLD